MIVQKRTIALASLFATLYAVGTIALSPISYGLVQVRLTDSLIALAFIPNIGMGVVLGVTLGNVVANVFSPYGLPDVVLGTMANLISSYTIYTLGRRGGWKFLILGCVIASVEIAAIIGVGLLYLIYHVATLEIAFGFVLIGELVSILLVGSVLTKAIMMIIVRSQQ